MDLGQGTGKLFGSLVLALHDDGSHLVANLAVFFGCSGCPRWDTQKNTGLNHLRNQTKLTFGPQLSPTYISPEKEQFP